MTGSSLRGFVDARARAWLCDHQSCVGFGKRRGHGWLEESDTASRGIHRYRADANVKEANRTDPRKR